MKTLYKIGINNDYNSGHIVTSRGLEPAVVVHTRTLIRKQIDSLSEPAVREGILSDILGLLLVHFSNLIIKLTKIKTLEDIKSISQPSAEIFVAIDEAIKDGSLILPYMVKSDGIAKSFSDMKDLSNSISNILMNAQKKEK
ncbi:hypothetical protein [Xenorhabdus budapestensis]|uniref:Uncharacterized protein n=1 Tax=Xenorhabdus budapestensis TaxID=290110 RepID=A0A2D0ITC4_XENBU|nr:hypothetical protein [Xenorhabdus budapestensis]PHM25142.1 hypothetical protein Xbud_03077 [Xenorhabdus budapestensis]